MGQSHWYSFCAARLLSDFSYTMKHLSVGACSGSCRMPDISMSVLCVNFVWEVSEKGLHVEFLSVGLSVVFVWGVWMWVSVRASGQCFSVWVPTRGPSVWISVRGHHVGPYEKSLCVRSVYVGLSVWGSLWLVLLWQERDKGTCSFLFLAVPSASPSICGTTTDRRVRSSSSFPHSQILPLSPQRWLISSQAQGPCSVLPHPEFLRA